MERNSLTIIEGSETFFITLTGISLNAKIFPAIDWAEVKDKREAINGATGLAITTEGAMDNGTYYATQASTSGSGVKANFTITVVGGVVTSFVVDSVGSGYAIGDTITLDVPSVAQTPNVTTAPVLTVETLI